LAPARATVIDQARLASGPSDEKLVNQIRLSCGY
jgi:hypothetical protein